MANESPIGLAQPMDVQPPEDPVASAIAEVAGPASVTAGESGAPTMLRGGAWNAGAQFAPLIVNLVMTPYVIHGLGLSRFGLYILMTSVADFLGTFDGGFYSSSQRYFAVYAGSNNRRLTSRLCFSLTIAVTILGSVMAAIALLAAPVLVAVFRIPQSLRAEGQFMLRILGVVIAMELLRGVFAALLNARGRFAISSLTTVCQYGVYTVGVIATLHYGWGLRGIALTLLVQTVLSTLVLAVASRRYLALSELRLLPTGQIMEFLRYSSRAQVSGLSDLINLQSDSLLIGGFLNTGSVALYSSGRNFASQMRSLPWNAIAPAASVLGQTFGARGGAAALVQFRQLQRQWVQACSGWIAVAAGAAYFGVTRWLGPGFRLAGIVAVVLLVGYLFRLWAGMLTVYCQTIGHPELEARYGALSVVVNLVLTLALVVPFGVLGVVAATALGQLVGSVYLLRLVGRKLDTAVPSFVGDVPWLASGLAALATVGLELLAWPQLRQGPLGLVEAGIVAAPGLLVFGAVLLGPLAATHALMLQTRSLVARSGRNSDDTGRHRRG